ASDLEVLDQAEVCFQETGAPFAVSRRVSVAECVGQRKTVGSQRRDVVAVVHEARVRIVPDDRAARIDVWPIRTGRSIAVGVHAVASCNGLARLGMRHAGLLPHTGQLAQYARYV